MDPILEQSIASAVTSAIAFALAILYAKHNNNIQSLREIFQKDFPSKKSSPPPDTQTSNNLAINLVDSGAFFKPSLLSESGSKKEK